MKFPHDNKWPDERTERLRKLFAAGLTAGQIATELHDVTRCAVIGKLGRLGLKLSPKNNQGRPHGTRKPRKQHRAPWRPVPVEQSIFATDLPPEPVANPVTLMELTEHTCRYPVDMPSGSMMYCGAEPAYDKPYCGFHCSKAFAGYGQAMSRAERELALRAREKTRRSNENRL